MQQRILLLAFLTLFSVKNGITPFLTAMKFRYRSPRSDFCDVGDFDISYRVGRKVALFSYTHCQYLSILRLYFGAE